jgi:hypothetical protein
MCARARNRSSVTGCPYVAASPRTMIPPPRTRSPA